MSPPFRRVLVANRGEIAVRVIRACHELGIEAVAVHSEADAGALHVRLADLAVSIGPAAPASSYLRIEALIEAARTSGAEAIHPGYGFLSERAAFARACETAGIVFVGPSAATLEELGDKLRARRVARAAGVPVVPGTLDPAPLEDPGALEALLQEAGRIGWPLLVKAAAGGGGRGMRLIADAGELPEALAAASREAAAAFGDGAVYLERVIRPARHVEVQLLGDAQGTVVALGERDCSIQRRHQKLVEEAPAPGLGVGARRDLHAMAVDVARATGLRSAATAEFLLDADGRAWFLEVNTRLQVEHGITELVSGLDLVHEQLRIAAGATLSPAVRAAAATATAPDRHAIEVRIGAEDPARDFAPTPGRITRWRPPGGPGVRVDAGVEEGSAVLAAYDSLVAKLMVVAPDRPSAIGRLRRAVDEFEVGGVQTTLPFHRALLREPAFLAGAVDTGHVEVAWRPAPGREAAARIAALTAALLVAGGAVGARGADASRGDWPDGSGPSPWRTEGRREAAERWP